MENNDNTDCGLDARTEEKNVMNEYSGIENWIEDSIGYVVNKPNPVTSCDMESNESICPLKTESACDKNELTKCNTTNLCESQDVDNYSTTEVCSKCDVCKNNVVQNDVCTYSGIENWVEDKILFLEESEESLKIENDINYTNESERGQIEAYSGLENWMDESYSFIGRDNADNESGCSKERKNTPEEYKGIEDWMEDSTSFISTANVTKDIYDNDESDTEEGEFKDINEVTRMRNSFSAIENWTKDRSSLCQCDLNSEDEDFKMELGTVSNRYGGMENWMEDGVSMMEPDSSMLSTFECSSKNMNNLNKDFIDYEYRNIITHDSNKGRGHLHSDDSDVLKDDSHHEIPLLVDYSDCVKSTVKDYLSSATFV